MPSVSARVSTRTPNRCTSRRRVSILFNKEHPCASDFCLKALADHSFMCHFQGCTTFTGPHDNRLVGGAEKGARRLSEWIHLLLTPGRRLGARHISCRTPRDPLPLPPVRGLMVVREGSRSCLGRACCHVRSIRGRKYTGWVVD